MELVGNDTVSPPTHDNALRVYGASMIPLAPLTNVDENASGNSGHGGHKTAVTIAWERHAARFSDADKKRFASFGQSNLNAYIQAINEACQKQKRTSKTFQVAEWFEPFFQVASMYLPQATQIASVYPNPSPLILGGISCIMSMSSRFLSFQEKIIRVISRMGRKLRSVLRYNQQIMHDFEVELTLVDIYGDILDFCKEVLSLLMNSEGQHIGGMRTLGLSLWNPFDRKFGDLIDKFEHDLDELQDKALLCDRKLAQNTFALQWQQTVNQRSSIADSSLYQQNVIAHLSHQKAHLIENRQLKERLQIDRKKKLVLEALPITDYLQHHEELLGLHLDGTGGWFLDHPSYLAWKDANDSRLLWVRGNPGCGKSVLAAFSINDLEQEMEDDIALAFTYCKALEEDSKNPNRLACSLLKQLCQQDKVLDQSLDNFYNKGGDMLKTGPGWSTITKSIINSVSSFASAYIVVDGFDECIEHEAFATLLVSLLEVFQTNVKILIFSRPNYPILERVFSGHEKLSIDSGETDADIEKYISSIVTSANLPVGKDETLIDDVRSQLLTKSEGSFLWVSLLVKALREQSTPNQVREAVNVVPSGLDSMYDSALRRIASQNNAFKRETAFRLLIWTLNSTRPLSQWEMLEALAVNPDTTFLDSGNVMPDARDLTACCADLVLLSKDKYFMLRHSSLKEYLFKLEKRGDAILEEFRHRQENSSKMILENCLCYMLLDNFVTATDERDAPIAMSLDTLLSKHPFLNYAAFYYYKHFDTHVSQSAIQAFCRLAMSNGPREICMSLLHKVDLESEIKDSLKTNPLHFIAYHGIPEMASQLPDVEKYVNSKDTEGFFPGDYALLGQNRAMSLWLLQTNVRLQLTEKSIFARVLPLHMSASLGWRDVLDELIEQKYDIDFCDTTDQRTPLMVAANEGQAEIVLVLIQAGASLGAGKSGRTPLIYAVESAHENVWKSLLDAGSDVNATTEDDLTALHCAMAKGTLAGIRLLIDHGADPKMKSGKRLSHQSCMHFAAANNRPELISFLLQRGLQVDVLGDNGLTPLHVAAYFGSLNAAKELLANDAMINAKDCFGKIALHMAAQYGHQDFVRYLIEDCCQLGLIDTLDEDMWTPLHFAAANGHSSVICYLLEQGACIDISSKQGQTALLLAVDNNHLDIATKLQSKGANCNVIDLTESSVLHYAAQDGYDHFIDVLVAGGAKSNAKNKHGHTALHFSAWRGHFDFVKQLCETFQDLEIDCTDVYGRTALSLAAYHGSAAVVEYLLTQRKASLMSNNDKQLPLHFASRGGHEDITKLLLTAENVNTKDSFGRTPLFEAVWNGHYGTAKLLLDNGAHTNIEDNGGYHALIKAADSEHFQVVRLLVARGASPKCVNSNGFTLLHAAVNNAEADFVKFLLDKGCDGLAMNRHGYSPFTNAVERDKHKIVDLLIERGFNGSRNVDTAGATCIHLAARNGSVRMLYKLIEEGADIWARDHLGHNAIHYAAKGGRKHMISVLHNLGLSCTIRSDLQETPLMMAAESRSLDTVHLLLELNPNQNLDVASSLLEETALNIAVSNHVWKIAEILRSAGASTTNRDSSDRNAWHIASGHKSTLLALQSREDAGNERLQEEKHRPVVLRKNLRKFLNTILAEATPRTIRQQYFRISLIPQLAFLLDLLDPERYELESLYCIYETYFSSSEMYFHWSYSCGTCGKKMFPGSIYACITCFKSTLCVDCHGKHLQSDKNPPLPEFLVIENLEKEMQPLRAVAEGLDATFIEIACALDFFTPVSNWLKERVVRYENWKKEHNADGSYDSYERPGEEFLELIIEAQGANQDVEKSASAADGGNTKDATIDNRWQTLLREYPAGCDFYEFPCFGHKFLFINVEEWVTLKENRDIFGVDGRLQHEWLKTLLLKLDTQEAMTDEPATKNSDQAPSSQTNLEDRGTASFPQVFEKLRLDDRVDPGPRSRSADKRWWQNDASQFPSDKRSLFMDAPHDRDHETAQGENKVRQQGPMIRRAATEPFTRNLLSAKKSKVSGTAKNNRSLRKQSAPIINALPRSHAALTAQHLASSETNSIINSDASPQMPDVFTESSALVEEPSEISDVSSVGTRVTRHIIAALRSESAVQLSEEEANEKNLRTQIQWSFNVRSLDATSRDETPEEEEHEVVFIYDEEDLDAKVQGLALRLSDVIFPGFSIDNEAVAAEHLSTTSDFEGEVEGASFGPELSVQPFSMPICGPFDWRNPWA